MREEGWQDQIGTHKIDEVIHVDIFDLVLVDATVNRS